MGGKIDITEATGHIKGIGCQVEGPVGSEVSNLCDLAEGMVNGSELRKEELLNILNFVSLSIQHVLKCVNDPSRKIMKIEWLKGKIASANRQLIDMKINNNNGHHDWVGKLSVEY